MYQDILVPTDGSQGVETGVARALDLALVDDATVHVLFVTDTGPEPLGLTADEREELRRHAEKPGREATARIQEQAEGLGLETVREVRHGVPYREILEYVDETGVDLVVMGTHGRTGAERARLGSTTERVVALADVPVLTVRLADRAAVPEPGTFAYDTVVIPTDGSDPAERAADAGLELAARYGAEVHVIYVVDTTTYGLDDAPRSIVGLLKSGGQHAVDAIAAEARDRNLTATGDVLRGVPEDELLAYATGVDADLAVMGTRGRGAAPERLLGSTTARVLRRSEIPVLAVK